jgi:hypothetical protein
MAESTESQPSPIEENELRAARIRERKALKRNPLEPPLVRSVAAPQSSAARRPIPYEVRQRFVQVGKIYYFQDGAKAFEDHGRRLTTPTDNSEVVASLVAIAQVRGWKRLVVRGSERFRQEAWRQATRLGLSVRGYTPSAVEQSKVAQDLARTRLQDSPAAPGPRGRPLPPKDQAPEVPLEPEIREPAASAAQPADRSAISGTLVASGAARYRFEAEGAPSFYVRLATASGERTFWGQDLRRALDSARSSPKVGDEVILRREGREAVSVRYGQRRSDGTTVDREEVKFRNRWSIETAAWLAERAALAQAFTDPSRTTAIPSPELAQARLALRQAELLAERQIPVERQRIGFVAAVRAQLAKRLAKGEAVAAPTLKAQNAELALRERGSRVP